MAQLKDLIVNGPSRFIGDVYATTFTGDLNGNANTATSANTAAALTGKTLVTASAVTTSNWSTYGNNHIPTMSFMAYWNGAYSGTSSNLTYCAQGTIIGSNNIGNQSVNYATSSGSCSGNAATATKATQDGNGNVITSTYLPLSGGTMTNPIKFSYNDNGNCNVSRTSGFSMFFGNQNGAINQGFPTQYSSVISFMTGYCGMQFATYGGNDSRLFFRKISDSDVWTPWYILLHSGNYNSYSPKLDGTGASGTWGISISGNAASATKATQDGGGKVIADTYLPLSGGIMTGVITSSYTGGTWINGVKNAIVKATYTTYGAVLSMPVKDGRVSLSSYPANTNNIYFGYATTTQISEGINSFNKQMYWDAANNNLHVDVFTGALSGNASTATKWETPRTITLTGSVIGSVSIDGSANVTLDTTTNHTHTGSEVTLTGYSHRDSYETINENDTVNQAIAKLEGALSGLETLLASI